MPKLIVTVVGKKEEQVFDLGERITIGRESTNTIVLAGAGVSREHAHILREENQYYLIDLGSGNGSVLNGITVPPHEKTLLKNNDLIVIENFHLRFWLTDELFEAHFKEEEEVTGADIVDVQLLKKILDAVDQESVPSLEVLNGCAQGKRFFIAEDIQEMTLGRDPDCDFHINEFVVSRQHAKIFKKWGGLALIDLESKNGTYINNKKITEEFLHDGDRLAVGTIVLLFRNPQEINVKEISEEMIQNRPPPPKQIHGSPREAEEILKDIAPMELSPANVYPVPLSQEKRWTPLEIGLIGLGILILSFALLTLIHLVIE